MPSAALTLFIITAFSAAVVGRLRSLPLTYLGGLLIGIAAWRWLRHIGWTVVLVVLVCATGAALTCWLVGYRLGPGDFSVRLAAARPGELVPIPLTLRARASLLTWPFFAIIPVLLGSSLGRDEDEPRPLLRRRRSRKQS